MKALHFVFLAIFFSLTLISWNTPIKEFIARGKQPEITLDSKGVVRIVFGRNDSIFCTTSHDKGANFSVPDLVGHIPKMHLGMSRGPQLASSANYSVITAMDEKGNINWFLLDHQNGKWINKGLINDQKGSAPEGLMGLAADDQDHFYAVWLDLRLNKHNNICFSSFSIKDARWSANKFIYQSPEGHTCECCKPNIAVRGNHVAVMFRNWLRGSRDLYVAESFNSGKTFSKPEKLGIGTWKLNGCPMDGGGLVIDDYNQVLTTWQREGVVYYCKPHEKEITIDKGKISSISSQKSKVICSYQKEDEIRIKDIITGKDQVVSKGSFSKSIILPDQSILLVWEKDQSIQFKKLPSFL
ncbi:MAG: hypothetical protein ACJ748_06715 [Flavisolibacter sp.]